MTTDRPEITMENTATTKVQTAPKRTMKSVVKLLAENPVVAKKLAKKKPKIKMVRDFSMPQVEYQKVADIKEVCLKAGIKVKKSEVFRAGLKVLGEMNEEQIVCVIFGLAKIKSRTSQSPLAIE